MCHVGPEKISNGQLCLEWPLVVLFWPQNWPQWAQKCPQLWLGQKNLWLHLTTIGLLQICPQFCPKKGFWCLWHPQNLVNVWPLKHHPLFEGIAQCENSMILLVLKFYVKSGPELEFWVPKLEKKRVNLLEARSCTVGCSYSGQDSKPKTCF